MGKMLDSETPNEIMDMGRTNLYSWETEPQDKEEVEQSIWKPEPQKEVYQST